MSKMYSMSNIQRKYIAECGISSDINEHLPTLSKYASECLHVTSCGGNNCAAAYALASALVGREGSQIVQIHNKHIDNIYEFAVNCANEGITRKYYQQNSLEAPITNTDLLFIDTWHVYGQLKRELERWNQHVGKYIIMHDTTVDEWLGETVRVGWSSAEQSRQTGIPENEIRMGLWPAIGEFLEKHPEWKIHERFTNNNGLTILKRA